MSKPTHPLTVLVRPTLAAALAFGLAAAPHAQAIDEDIPGAPAPAAAFDVRAAEVDDRDPGSAPYRARLDDALEVGSDQDVGAGMGLLTVAPAVSIGIMAERLDDGRDGAPVLARAVDYDGPLDDGRDPNAPLALRTAPAYDGPLDDGRPEGARRAVVADEPATPVRDTAPQAAAEAAPEGTALSLVRPNPARDRAELTFSLEAPGAATIRVFDVRGREVAVAFDAAAPAGAPQTVALDVSTFAPGTYVAVLTAPGARVSQTFQVVR